MTASPSVRLVDSPDVDPPLFAQTMDAADLATQFEVALQLDLLRLTEPGTHATIGLDSENEVRAAIARLPQYDAGVRPEWREFVA